MIVAANPPGALALAVLPRSRVTCWMAAPDVVIYLGAGQRVLGPLEELVELAGSHEIVLVARSVADPVGAAGEGRESGVRQPIARAVRSAASCSRCATGRRPGAARGVAQLLRRRRR